LAQRDRMERKALAERVRLRFSRFLDVDGE
jgi:hypothetical protein